MGIGSTGDAVDHVIGLVVEPLAVVDHFVSHIGTGDESEGADNRAGFVHHHVTVALLNVVLEFLLQRIALWPLVDIAIAPHDLPGLVAKFQDLGQVNDGGSTE